MRKRKECDPKASGLSKWEDGAVFTGEEGFGQTRCQAEDPLSQVMLKLRYLLTPKGDAECESGTHESVGKTEREGGKEGVWELTAHRLRLTP